MKKTNIITFLSGLLIGFLFMFLFHYYQARITRKDVDNSEEIKHSINRIIVSIKEAEATIDSTDVETGKSMNKTIQELLKLRFYYIPMTEVRRLIYDADVLFNEKKNKDALKKLAQAKKILLLIDKQGGPMLRKSLKELYIMIDAVMYDIKEIPSRVQDGLKEAGNKLNLMVIRGEFNLRDTEFKE